MTKKIITAILGVFVIASVGAIIYKNTAGPASAVKAQAIPAAQNAEKTVKTEKAEAGHIDAVYFHTTARCYSCNLMEKYIRETLDGKFSKQMKNGKIKFQAINVQIPENRHYVQDYKLYTKSFVLSLKSGGEEKKWINCDKIWNLVRNETAFKNYIKAEVESYLGML